MKALSTLRPYLRWLIWPGLAMTTAGLISGFVGAWTTIPVALLVAGVVLTQIGLFMGGGYRDFLQSRSTQAGTNAVLATLSVLLILAVANFLALEYGPRIDFTEGGLYTLAPETQAVVSNLRQPVKVVLFDASLNANDKDLLEEYQKINENLTYEYVNPFQNPGIAREFNVSGEGREVHLAVGDRKIFVQPLSVQGLNEQNLTNKLAQIGRDRNAVVYFLQGHDEFLIDGSVSSGYAQAAAALEEDGFTVDTLNFDEIGVVPGDANALIIAGPKQIFFEPEVEILEAYLNEGGSILLMVDPQTNPELDSLLAEWGVTLDERLIVDASNTGQLVGLGPAAPLVTDYGEHPITEAFEDGRSFYPLARPVLIEDVEGVEATPLLLSNAQSYAEELSPTGELNVDTEQEPEGPFNIGVVLTREIQSPDSEATESSEESFVGPVFEEIDEESADEASVNEEESADESDPSDAAEDSDDEDTQVEGRLVVIGNATFATDGLFGQQLNGEVFLNSVTWLSNLEDSILSIRAKEITNRRIYMTVSRQILVIVLALVVLPLIGLIGAAVTWIRRR